MLDQIFVFLNQTHGIYWLPVLLGSAVFAGVYFVALRPAGVSAPADAPPVEVAPPSDPYNVGAQSEQRRAFRREGNPIEAHYATPEAREAPLTGYVVDRSVGGLCLLIADPLPEGTALVVRPVKAEQMVPWMEVKVCSCRPSPDRLGYEVGCSFIKTPPYSILLLLG